MANNPYLRDNFYCTECSREFKRYHDADLHVKIIHTKEIMRDPKTGRWTKQVPWSVWISHHRVAIGLYLVLLIVAGVVSYYVGVSGV